MKYHLDTLILSLPHLSSKRARRVAAGVRLTVVYWPSLGGTDSLSNSPRADPLPPGWKEYKTSVFSNDCMISILEESSGLEVWLGDEVLWCKASEGVSLLVSPAVQQCVLVWQEVYQRFMWTKVKFGCKMDGDVRGEEWMSVVIYHH